MNGISETFERMADYQIADMPVGAAGVLMVADALATAVSDVVRRATGVPPLALDLGLAYADARFKLAQRLVGVQGQYLVDAILIKRAADSQWNITSSIHNMLTKVTSALPGASSPTSGMLTGSEVGYMPAPSSGVGELSPDVGDIILNPQPGESSEVANILEARESLFRSMAI